MRRTAMERAARWAVLGFWAAGASAGADSTASGFQFRRVENRAFRVGEALTFEVAYGVVNAGTAVMSIPDTQWVQGRPCYHIVTTAESNAFFSKMFRVRDRVESVMDMEGLFSWHFEKHLREGGYKSNRIERFDPRQRLAYTKRDTIRTPPFVQDILSAFYYTRTRPLQPGQPFDIECFSGKHVYPLRVLVHRREKAEVPAGKFRCIVVEPVLRGEGLFNQKGKLTIWLTDDERRIPVLMKSKVLIGSIDCRLKTIVRP
ncbi:MAG: DUF3108 domain-containing protein [bacterium]|nr:DUF3108 domain-containing protein [bacterium]